MTVVAPPQVAGQLVDQFNAAPGEPLQASASNHGIEARQALRAGVVLTLVASAVTKRARQ